jgi:hypothetical protein
MSDIRRHESTPPPPSCEPHAAPAEGGPQPTLRRPVFRPLSAGQGDGAVQRTAAALQFPLLRQSTQVGKGRAEADDARTARSIFPADFAHAPGVLVGVGECLEWITWQPFARGSQVAHAHDQVDAFPAAELTQPATAPRAIDRPLDGSVQQDVEAIARLERRAGCPVSPPQRHGVIDPDFSGAAVAGLRARSRPCGGSVHRTNEQAFPDACGTSVHRSNAPRGFLLMISSHLAASWLLERQVEFGL